MESWRSYCMPACLFACLLFACVDVTDVTGAFLKTVPPIRPPRGSPLLLDLRGKFGGADPVGLSQDFLGGDGGLQSYKHRTHTCLHTYLHTHMPTYPPAIYHFLGGLWAQSLHPVSTISQRMYIHTYTISSPIRLSAYPPIRLSGYRVLPCYLRRLLKEVIESSCELSSPCR
jgi:hypothetical protein